jgi:hypothetical protein
MGRIRSRGFDAQGRERLVIDWIGDRKFGLGPEGFELDGLVMIRRGY